MTDSDFEKADRLSQRRARVLSVVAIIFISQQVAYFSESAADGRLVDQVKIGAWLLLSAVILATLLTGGMWVYPRRIRAMANDEVTQAHQAKAIRVGFVCAMLCCLLLYLVVLFEPMEARDAIHLITTIGLGSALLSFAFSERRAMRD